LCKLNSLEFDWTFSLQKQPLALPIKGHPKMFVVAQNVP